LQSQSLNFEAHFGLVLALTLIVSDSFFDSPPELVSCISSIAEWRKDIPAPVVSEEDLFYSSEFQDMTSSDFFELKDTVSECSMDSAYQSQSGASRRGLRKPDGHAQDNRSRVTTHFAGSEIYSPSLSSESYNAFADQTLDMSQMRQPTGTWETPEDSIVYANYSAGQDYSQYSTANVPRYTPTSNNGMSSPWVPADAQFQNEQFSFTYPAAHNTAELMFSPPVQAPRLDARTDAEDNTSTSVPTQPLEENEDVMSASDAAELKLEEERTKVARSHPLYQRMPDKDGKYHCPEEGNAGCSHKPTPLKCNYE
jgi:hypothetical protein